MEEAKLRRVFFALYPVSDVQEQISELVNTLPLKGKITAKENFHVTLVFLGTMKQTRIDKLIRLAQDIAFRPFSFSLDSYGYFKRAKVAWLGCSHTPPGLYELQQQLVQAAAMCHISTDERSWELHLTVARKSARLARDEQSEFNVKWQDSRFYLMESVSTPQGVRYHVLHTFESR